MAQPVAALIVRVAADVSEIKGNVEAIIGHLTTLSNSAQKTGAQLSQVGRTMTAAVTVPLVGIGAAALKAAIDFETAFSGVKKTVSGTPAELAKLNAELREMAKTTPMSAVGIAHIAESAGQLGVAKEKISAFTKTIVDITTVTNLTAEEAGTSFAKLANVMHISQDEFKNLGSAVYQLGNFGASTEQEMLGMAQRIAAAGASAGLTAPQVLGISNALASVGIEAEAGGTAVSRVITKMATDVASGKGHLEDFAHVAGMTGSEFQAAWGKNAGEALGKFFQGLANVKDKGESLFGTMDELGFKEVRLKNAMLSAANAGALMADSIKLGNEAFSDTTKFTAAAEERYKTTANQLKMLWGQINDVAIELGNSLLPILKDVVAVVHDGVPIIHGLVDIFTAMPQPVRLAVIAVAGIVAAVGPVLVILGTLISTGGAVAALFGTTLPAAFGTLLPFLGPAGWIALAVIAVYEAWKHWDKIAAIAQAVYTGVKTWLVDKFEAVVASIKAKVAAVTGFFGDMYDKVVGHSYVPDMVNQIGEHFGRLDQVMVHPAQAAANAVAGIFDHLGTVLNGKIQGMLSGMSDKIGGFLTSTLSGFASALTGGLAGIASGLVSKGVGALVNHFRGGEEGVSVNPARDAWFAAHGNLEGVNSAAMNDAGLSWEQTEAMDKAVFAASTMDQFNAATQAFSQAGVPGFAFGSNGMQDFGRGTMAMLHGKEEVRTSAQKDAESARFDALARELRGLREDFQMLPRMMRDAVLLA